MPPTCSLHRRRAHAPVRTPEDALTTLAVATHAGRDTCVVIGSVDRRRRPLALLVIEEARGSDLPLAVDALVVGVRPLGAGGPVAAVFLACSGTAAVTAPGPAERRQWTALDRQLSDAGITLLDWFMLADGIATSVPDLVGGGSAW